MFKLLSLCLILKWSIVYGDTEKAMLDLNLYREKYQAEDDLFLKDTFIKCNPIEIINFSMNKISKVEKIRVNFKYSSFPNGDYTLGLYGKNDLPLSHNIGRGYPRGLLVAKDKKSILVPTGTNLRMLKITPENEMCKFELFEESAQGIYVKKIVAEK